MFYHAQSYNHGTTTSTHNSNTDCTWCFSCTPGSHSICVIISNSFWQEIHFFWMASIILKASKSCANKNIYTLLATSFHLFVSLFLFYLTICNGSNWDSTFTACTLPVMHGCKTKVIRYTLTCDADVKMSDSDGKVIITVMYFFSSYVIHSQS